MPDKTEQGISALTQLHSLLPEYLSRAILKHIHQCIHYEPTIGIMGKSGVGKSSLCNTLFNPPPAKVSAIKGCTRRIQTYQLALAPHGLPLPRDLPNDCNSRIPPTSLTPIHREITP